MKQNYIDRMLAARDPRYRQIADRLGYGTRMMTARRADPEAALKRLRAEYQRVVGKRPYHAWDAATLRAKIAEARS